MNSFFVQEKYYQTKYLFNKLNNLGLKKNDNVLDAGCGIGILGKFIKEYYSSTVYGIDMDKASVEIAKANGEKVTRGTLEGHWPYKDNFFDYVISVQVLEHLINPDNFLSESRRVLKENGILVISTPNLAAWFNRLIFLFGYQPFFLEASTQDKTIGLKFTRRLTKNRQPLGHVRVFTLYALDDLLKLHKFKVLETRGGEVNYLPQYMKPFDKLFSYIPSLATDLIVIAKKT